MILRRILSFLGAFGLTGATTLLAAEISDPVGAFRIRLRGNSDTIVSLPLQRPALIEAAIASSTNNALLLEADIPALPPEGAFALVMTGPLEGAVLPIASVNARTLTVDATGFDLASLRTVTANTAPLADLVAVVPYWTLDTLFPGGQSVHASSNILQRHSEVLFFDDSAAGINKTVSATYYYYSGTALLGPGWYKVGDTQNKAGGLRLLPQRYFIVRHNKAEDTPLTIAGGVQLTGFRIPLFTRAANTDQDNIIAIPVPIPVALENCGLIASAAFRPTTNPLARGDELLVFDNTVVAKNKAVAATYYYYQGTGLKGTGWYKVGDVQNRMDTALLHPGEGIIIRRKATATAESKPWTGLPAYLQ